MGVKRVLSCHPVKFLGGGSSFDFVPKNNRPKKFNKWRALWGQWDDWLEENKVTAVQAAVSFALSDNRITKVIVGVDSLDQLKEIITAANRNINRFPQDLNVSDMTLLNPSEWATL